MSTKKISTHVTETTATEHSATLESAATTTVTTASPLADRVSQAITHIKMAIALLALDAPAITPAQRKALVRMRKGGDKLVPEIAAMAEEWGVEIRTQPNAVMTSALQTTTDLAPLVTVLAGFLQNVEDAVTRAGGISWQTATALYVILKRMSHMDVTLQAQLAPAVAYFAYRHPVVTEAQAAAKPAKTSERKAKMVAQAEKIVAAAKAETGESASTPASVAPAGAAAQKSA